MNMNPIKLLGLKDKFNATRNAHPKFVQFIDYIGGKIEKDSIISVKVTLPDGKEVESSIKVTEEDIALLKAVREL